VCFYVAVHFYVALCVELMDWISTVGMPDTTQLQKLFTFIMKNFHFDNFTKITHEEDSKHTKRTVRMSCNYMLVATPNFDV
jgi:hypothetical protein